MGHSRRRARDGQRTAPGNRRPGETFRGAVSADHWVDLIGTIIDPKDLSRLSGLGSLTELSLPGPIFTPFSDAPLDANEPPKQLAGLSKIDSPFLFSLHFLPTYNVDDRGVGYLAPLTSLRELRLSQVSCQNSESSLDSGGAPNRWT